MLCLQRLVLSLVSKEPCHTYLEFHLVIQYKFLWCALYRQSREDL